MSRLALAAAIAIAGCAGADDRPITIDYITEAILAPSCGAASCHSSFRQQSGYVFDDVPGTRASFQGDPILITPSDETDPASPPGLILNLTRELPGAPRMPYYEPMPDHDVALIDRWLRAGAPGVCTGTKACLGNLAVPCKTVTISGLTYPAAYDLEKLNTPMVDDCAAIGASAGTPMICRSGACVGSR